MQFLLDTERDEGVTPQALRDMPKLDLRQVLIYNTFQDLTGSRNFSMTGPLPIPYPVFSCYCADHEIRGAEKISQLWQHIQKLDGVYLEHAAEKSKTK